MNVGATDSASLYLSAFAYSASVTGNTRTISVTELDVGIEATGPGAASFISAVRAALDRELGIDTTGSTRVGTAAGGRSAAPADASNSPQAIGREPEGEAPGLAQTVADFVAALVTAVKSGGSDASGSLAVPATAYAGGGADVGSALKRLIDAPSAAGTGTAAQTATADLERAFSRLLASIAPPAGADAPEKSAPTLGSFLASLARQLEQSPSSLLSPGSVFRSVA